ncbi:MAG TPA: hypothetical protein VIV56_07215 [Gemmatimonadales bacterium]
MRALTLELGVTRAAVYSWLAATREPRPEVARSIVRVSGGEITLSDIYGHRSEVRDGAGSAGGAAGRRAP